jgi:hypothetical protein
MPERKRGGQAGNQNAVKHGRHSAPVRAARHVATLALYAESKRKSDEWVRLCPATDYGAIVDHLRELRRRKAAGSYQKEALKA